MATLWNEQLDQVRTAEAIIQSGGTNGRSLHKIDSIGMGSFRLASPIEFQVKFIEEPLFTSGVVVADGASIPRSGFEPVTSVGVWKWVKQGRLYTGAYIWFAVSQSVANGYDDMVLEILLQAQKLHLRHHLAFEGFAIRDVDYDAIMAD